MSVQTKLGDRGVKDVFFVICDSPKGLPGVVENMWPQAIVQTSSGWFKSRQIRSP
jgi:transposase-like protein